jgi:hypothetical protein
MNGVDAVVLATGNDFRAVEAGFMPMLQNQVSTPAYLTLKSKMVYHILARDPVSSRNCRWTNYFTSFSYIRNA